MSEKKITAGTYDIIRRPVITEKSQVAVEHNKYTFYIAKDADKDGVKKAVESLFGVKVKKVNVINKKGKSRRFRGVAGRCVDSKKAIVTLAEGHTIDTASTL